MIGQTIAADGAPATAAEHAGCRALIAARLAALARRPAPSWVVGSGARRAVWARAGRSRPTRGRPGALTEAGPAAPPAPVRKIERTR